jgi:hypothetical protein
METDMEQFTTDTTATGPGLDDWPIPRDGVAVTHLLIVRDPDSHLIEVGQTTGIPGARS